MDLITDPAAVDRTAWEQFVRGHRHGSIYQTPYMYDTFARTQNFQPLLVAAVHPDGSLAGVMLGAAFQEMGGIKGSLTRRELVRGGPLADSDEALDALLGGYDELADRDAIYTNISNMRDVNAQAEIFRHHGYEYEPHLNFLFDLTVGEEALWEGFHSNVRNKVRKSRKEGLVSEKIEGLPAIDLVYSLLEATYDRAGIPLVSQEFFRNMYEVLEPLGMIPTFCLYDEAGEMVGVRIELYFNGKLHDWHAGNLSSASRARPNERLVWEVLAWGANNGAELFDFGGAGHADKPYGVRDFKSKFKGEQVEHGVWQRVHKPGKKLILDTGRAVLTKLGRSGR